MEKIKCPICYGETEYLIIDLNMCTECSHIFKSHPKYGGEKIPIEHLHNYVKPVEQLSKINDTETNDIELEFPNIILHDLEISPNKFYNAGYNHFFNQMSLMILLKKCGFRTVKQMNYWHGKTCVTKILITKDGY